MGDVVYTDEEAASLTSEQFNQYMNGGDPLGKGKKKKAEPEPASKKKEKPTLGILGKHFQKLNEVQ